MSDDDYLEGYNDGLQVGKKAVAVARAENEKLRAALKRLHDAGASIGADELPWSILEWWNKELADAASALKETGDE